MLPRQTMFLSLSSSAKGLLLMLVLMLVSIGAQAQMYNVFVKNDKGIPIGGVKVYSFMRSSEGIGAYKQASSTDANAAYSYGAFDKQRYKTLTEDKTAGDGYCLVNCSSEGSIMLDGFDVPGNVLYGVAIYHIKDCKIEADNTVTLILKGQETGKEKEKKAGEFTNFEEEVKVLKEVPTTATIPMETAGGGVERHGKNNILIVRDLDIDGEHARGDARFVVFPTIVFTQYKDSVTYMPPMAVDGVEYSRVIDRRMSYKASNDLLSEFIYDRGTHLEHNLSERVTYAEWAKIEKGTSYRIPAVAWYEDLNGVYHEDSILFSDGKEREPMRFLNWEEARKFAALDTTLTVFKRRGTVSSVPVSKDFKIAFEQGKASLNLADSATNAQRDNLIAWLNAYYSNRNALIKGITVRAYSSPEGSESRNRSLSRERANSIRQLLASRFNGVKIEPYFDEFDNIVPWNTIADSMSLMEDTVARRYADQVRAITEVHVGFDAQYRAIRAQADLYDYIDKNILDRVRIVSVEADIIEQTVLTKAQIVDKYYNEAGFLDAIRPYQAYELLCYLSAENKWDELYDVAKKIFEFHSKEHRIDKQMLKAGSKNELTIVKDLMVPYPLAAYYYALACMHRGEVNKDILKHYMDDGRVATPGSLRHDEQGVNLMAFIVAQVLMCCQDEAFDEANNLIRKYNLITIPELEGLIMFVRCLDGQYTSSEEVRQYVMSTSPMNKAVILTAMGKYDEALSVLYGGDVPEDDAKVEYLRAICLFRKQSDANTRFEAESLPATALYQEVYDDGYGEEKKQEENKNAIPTAWATPMLNAFRLDETNVDYLRNDGYFNNAYRQMVLYAWERMKDGIPLDRISKEYAALVSKMKKDKEKFRGS